MVGAAILTCFSLLVVDGDTVRCDGVDLRDMGDGAPYVSGYDTPETHRPKCQEELELGRVAAARMEELIELLA